MLSELSKTLSNPVTKDKREIRSILHSRKYDTARLKNNEGSKAVNSTDLWVILTLCALVRT
jgi:hypothetical protein